MAKAALKARESVTGEEVENKMQDNYQKRKKRKQQRLKYKENPFYPNTLLTVTDREYCVQKSQGVY